MRPSLAEAFAGAGAIWRTDRALIVPVVGLFYFVPTLALLLLLPEGSPAAGGQEAALDALLAYARANAGAILTANLVQIAGAALLFIAFLAPARPTLGEAARVLAGRLLSFVAAGVMIWAALTIGALLIVPALYLIGRLFLVGTVLAAEPRAGPIEAFARSWALTQGRGWWCFVAAAIPFLAGQVVVSLAGGLDRAAMLAGGGSAPLHLAFNALAALAATVAWALTLLVKVVVYRALTRGT